MDSAEKKIKQTIKSLPDQDLYSIGEAEVLSDEAQKKAYTLQKEAKEGKKEIPDDNHLKADYWY